MSGVPAVPAGASVRRSAIAISLFVAVACCAGAGSNIAIAANSPTTVETPRPITPSAVDIHQDDRPARAAARPREPRGNPLWAIPLSTLSVTRERPLFLASRRPPVAPAVAGPPVVVAAKPVEDPRPELTLVGAVAGETEGFAIFIDQRNNATVRLRTGQEHAGWTLSSVKGREVTLAKDKDTVAFVLPAPGTNGIPAMTPPAAAVSAGPDGSAVAAAANGDMVMPKSPRDFAPYTPRSTPKNGESDGL